MKKIILALVVNRGARADGGVRCCSGPESDGLLAGQSRLDRRRKAVREFRSLRTAQGDKQEANTTNAAKTCKAERALGVDAFTAKYGTNKNKANAFGKCVSKIASAKTIAQQTAEVNAAKKCKAAPLKDQIGASPKTYRNFGACVKAQSKTS